VKRLFENFATKFLMLDKKTIGGF